MYRLKSVGHVEAISAKAKCTEDGGDWASGLGRSSTNQKEEQQRSTVFISKKC